MGVVWDRYITVPTLRPNLRLNLLSTFSWIPTYFATKNGLRVATKSCDLRQYLVSACFVNATPDIPKWYQSQCWLKLSHKWNLCLNKAMYEENYNNWRCEESQNLRHLLGWLQFELLSQSGLSFSLLKKFMECEHVDYSA